MTLKFLGEVPEERLGDVTQMASAVTEPAFKAVIAGFGAFPSPKRARVLWAGVRDDPEGAAARVAGSLESSAGEAGLRQEGRAFTPHVTVARIRDQADAHELLIPPPESVFREFPVEEFILFRSRLSPKGATYEAIESFPLARR